MGGVFVIALVGCGSSSKNKTSATTSVAKSTAPTVLSITTTDVGKKNFKMEAPSAITGGVVTVNFRNGGKAPHEAQLIRLDGGHTISEVLKIVGVQKPVIPNWLHPEGGVASVPPGGAGTATVKLVPGTYGVIDADTGSGNGPPPALFGAQATVTVAGDNGGTLPATDATITATDKGKDKYAWEVTNLTAGTHNVTFDNKSKQIHLVFAAPIVGKANLAQIKTFLSQQNPTGRPPIDFLKAAGASILDGKTTETTQLTLTKGHYALICFLTDRDGKGKPHFQEGMLKVVTVQ